MGENRIALWYYVMQNPAQPNIEEIHQIGVGNGVVVGWICTDDVKPSRIELCRRLLQNRCLGSSLGGCLEVLDHTCDPFDRLYETAGRILQWTGFCEIPDDWKGESGESATNFFGISWSR